MVSFAIIVVWRPLLFAVNVVSNLPCLQFETFMFAVRYNLCLQFATTIRMGNAPANLSVMRAIALNVLRRNGHTSITTAQRFISHDIDKLLALVE